MHADVFYILMYICSRCSFLFVRNSKIKIHKSSINRVELQCYMYVKKLYIFHGSFRKLFSMFPRELFYLFAIQRAKSTIIVGTGFAFH